MNNNHLLIDLTSSNFCKEIPDSLDFYSTRLIRGFKEYSNYKLTALVWQGTEEYVDSLIGFHVDKIVVDRNCRITPWQQLDRVLGLLPLSLKKEMSSRSIGVVLSPYHIKCGFFFSKQYHQYTIVHDLIPYYVLKEAWSPLRYFVWRIFRKLLTRKISKYISISEGTRKELKRLEGVDSIVIYNSIPFDFSVDERPVDSVKGKKYILDVNKFDRYKNAEILIRGFNQIKDKIPHFLYLKGNKLTPGGFDFLKTLVSDLKLENRVILDDSYRSEEEMRYLYCHADLFVSPSIREGFGWTPIEAAILETPVLISNIEVLVEVSCNKIPTFNPYSAEDLSEKMYDILNNPPNEKERKELAMFFLDKYSLKSQIEKIVDTFAI